MVQKILIIRFSSIGDIVLTSPVIRCLRLQLPQSEIHYITKEVFAPILKHNPYIHKLHTFKSDISEIIESLQKEKFDVVIDLHKNLRSLRLKQKLSVKAYSFNKLNLKKFLAVNFKLRNILPPQHIVQRYLDTLLPLGVNDDKKGLDYFIGKDEQLDIATFFGGNKPSSYIALVLGGSYFTKKIPSNKLKEICERASLPIILLGGTEDKAEAEILKKQFPEISSTCGLLSLNQSASVIQQAEWVITSDTGLMHMASAFQKKIISLWGNTIPEFGMGPYLPSPENKILEVKDLSCRPCSKLGYHQCPKKHFKCMNLINLNIISELK